MEPFTILCSTCQSRIRVRNPSLIGQLANCPKCNSMIQIALPQQIRVESDGYMADSSAMTKEGITAPAEDEYRLAPEDHTSFDDEVPALIAPPIASADNWTPVPAPVITPPMPTQEWSSSNAARTRQMLIVGFLGLGGVLVAGLLFVGFQRWYSGTSKANQANQLAKAPEPPLNNIPPVIDPQLDPLDVPAQPTNVATGDVTAEPNSTEVASSETSTGEPVKEPSSNTLELEKPKENSANSEDKPLPDETTADQPATAELPKQLESFSQILERSFEPSMVPDGVEKQKPPPTLEELGIPSAAESKAIPPVDIAKHLEFRIAGLVLPDTVPLSSAINLWVQLSGIPTIVDLDSLSAVGFDFKPIALKITESTTIEQLRDAYAEKLGVRFEQADPSMPFLAVYASHGEMKEKLPESIRISDLVEDDEQHKWLLKALDQLFPLQSGKWKISDGNLSPDPMVDAPTWLWTIRMLESWRDAAKKPSALADADTKPVIKLATQYVNVDEFRTIDQPLKLSIKEASPTGQLLSQICNSAGLQGWIDWVSVGANGLGPSSSDMLVTQGRSLRQCMKVLSEKYGLIVAIENDKAIWITTPTAYRQQVRLYVLPSQGKTAEQWQDELQPLTPLGPNGVEPVRVIPTPDNNFVIVRCCRPRL